MNGGLHAGVFDCLASRVLVSVRWLNVFERNKLPDLTSVSWPWCLILNTDPKDQPATHLLAFYAPSAGPVELFDLFGLFPINYGLDSLGTLHLDFPLQLPSTSVGGHYCIVYIYHRSRNKSLSDIIHLLLNMSNRHSWDKRYIHNLQNLFRIIIPCHPTKQCCKLQCQFC